MLQWVIDAAKDSKLIDGVVVATSTMASDLPIVEHCHNEGIYCRTGSLDDVLGRFYAVAMEWRPTHIVRLTADCPLLTGEIIDSVIREYLSEGYRYVVNNCDGVDVEVFTYGELLKAHKLVVSKYDREHVTTYMQNECDAGLMEEITLFCRNDIERKNTFSVNTQEEFDRMGGILCSLNQNHC